MSEYSDEKQESILRKVRQMLAMADDPASTAAEADLARTRAEALMLKYRITEATAVKSGEASVVPIWREVELNSVDSEYSQFYHSLAGIVMVHVGARGVSGWKETENGFFSKMEWTGYLTDLTYGEMLLTAAMVEFSRRLEPRLDPSQSDRDNIYAMRSAGMERKRIAKLVYGDWSTENEMKAKNRKVTKEFRAACEERGEDADALLGRGNNVKTYRLSYAHGFVQTLNTRLARLRAGQTEVEGGGLVLADRKGRVDESFYARFPQYRPKTGPDTVANEAEQCPKCKKAKSGYCREHSYRRPVKGRSIRVNRDAYSRGSTAATAVDLGPNAAGRGKVQEGARRQLR